MHATKMDMEGDYDCAIIGGGVAGLALAILLARQGRRIVLVEKEDYPFNKVCGEYISNESVRFIGTLGVDLSARDLPRIDSLLLSSVSGIAIVRRLSVGGVGFSRYHLDHLLYRSALGCGADIRTKTRAQSVRFEGGRFLIGLADRQITAKTVCGAYGKNSNLDVQLNRATRADHQKRLFIAVKRHVRLPAYDRAQVGMHNFPGGYCGLSAIEDGKVNMSYIATAESLRSSGNTIPEFEARALSVNPFLKKVVREATYEFEKPLVISHLHFGMKTAVEGHILMLGDAAGNIAPLSGNGISMALRSAAIASQALADFLARKRSRAAMESGYQAEYRKAFAARIRYARMIHQTFGKPLVSDLSFHFLRTFPFLVDYAQAKIHGEEF